MTYSWQPSYPFFVSPLSVPSRTNFYHNQLSRIESNKRASFCRIERRNANADSVVHMTAFRKYHGLGNDFVLIDNRNSSTPLLTSEQSVAVCDRHTGVGADGVIFMLPATQDASDISMRLYNSDGTEPEMCGNGIRCLARFAADLSVPSHTAGTFVIDTLAGRIVPELVPSSGAVRVDMGAPILSPADVPTTLATTPENRYVDTLFDVAGSDWSVTCVSMGNPHAIIFVDDAKYEHLDRELERIGPHFENNLAFPQRTNTEFVRAISETEFDMIVWERGAGRTRACGTGACAVVVAAILNKKAQKDVPVTVHLPGGDLIIEWASESNHILMTGPAELVFEGQLADSLQ